MNIAIVIPSRFNSTRFPGKPLALIAGKMMIERVIKIAQVASFGRENIRILVATDNELISKTASSLNAEVVLVNDAATGSDRVLKAINKTNYNVDYIINFQGDAPLTPPKLLSLMIDELENKNEIEVLTPIIRLTWEELDHLRILKEKLGSSGTTVTQDQNNNAIWFSKNIIPQIRKENRSEKYSPILRHIGIYCFRKDILEKFVSWPRSYYEKIEELEQLRILENNHKIKLLDVTNIEYPIMSGIDMKEDITEAEHIIQKYGELI